MPRQPRLTVALAAAGALLLGSAAALPGAAQDATPMAGSGRIEVALADASGADVGTATFEEGDGGVTLSIEVEGLEPGEHGWHLHAMGECDPSGLEPFATAGPHWNPTGDQHGGPDDPTAHVGDFGNLVAGENGRAEMEMTTDRFTLSGGSTSVGDLDGTAIVIHQGMDDLVSQPSGNSGGRYACGVVAAPMGMAAATPVTAESTTNSPQEVAFAPELLDTIQLPDGFEIAVFAQGVTDARMMAVGPDGTVYVTQPDANNVSALRDTDGDNAIDEAEVVAENLPMVHGITIHEGRVYLAGEEQVWAADLNEDGTLGTPEAIVNGLPVGAQHPYRTIRFGPDGMMYVHIGSACNDCPEINPENATVLRFNPDGTGREIFASGLRNTLGYVWQPETGAMWGMDMGSDRRGDDTPPDELNRLEQGGNYGWPWC